MARDLIAEQYPWETRVAILEDGRLVEVFWSDREESVGNIYKGRVKDVIPGCRALLSMWGWQKMRTCIQAI